MRVSWKLFGIRFLLSYNIGQINFGAVNLKVTIPRLEVFLIPATFIGSTFVLVLL